MLSDFVNKADTVALSTPFHDNYLKVADFEKVNFWMQAGSPSLITTDASVLSSGDSANDGYITTATVYSTSIIGILFDDEYRNRMMWDCGDGIAFDVNNILGVLRAII